MQRGKYKMIGSLEFFETKEEIVELLKEEPSDFYSNVEELLKDKGSIFFKGKTKLYSNFFMLWTLLGNDESELSKFLREKGSKRDVGYHPYDGGWRTGLCDILMTLLEKQRLSDDSINNYVEQGKNQELQEMPVSATESKPGIGPAKMEGKVLAELEPEQEEVRAPEPSQAANLEALPSEQRGHKNRAGKKSAAFFRCCAGRGSDGSPKGSGRPSKGLDESPVSSDGPSTSSSEGLDGSPVKSDGLSTDIIYSVR